MSYHPGSPRSKSAHIFSFVFTPIIAVIGCLAPAPVSAFAAGPGVYTWRNDIGRTGQNLNEQILTPVNVNSSSFGKLFSIPVDGQVYAQPLYVPGVQIPGRGTHNVLYIATEHDSVYAFDADSPNGDNSNPLWQASMLDASRGAAVGATTEASADASQVDIVPEIGITGTPVIDPDAGTMYLIAKSWENNAVVQRLHALDITTGAERPNSPVLIQASVPGTGNGSVDGVLSLDPRWAHNRPGLLLLNGIVYAGFGSHGDNGPWHGWILSYDAATLTQKGVYCPTPNGIGSGFWMSGAGLAADVVDPNGQPFGRMFVATGNGSFNATPPFTQDQNFSDDVLHLDLANGQPTVVDSFTPFSEAEINWSDEDLGAGGVLLLPDQPGDHAHLLVEVGKQGIVYLVDRDNMGAFTTGEDRIVQRMTGQVRGLWSAPAYWNGHVYFGGASDSLKSFTVTNGLLSWTPASMSTEVLGYPGASPAISADGNNNGIVWTVDNTGFSYGGKAVLTAHDASDVSRTLYSSNENPDRDNPGGAIKFIVPTITNGKVYVGGDRVISVYGLLNSFQPTAATPIFDPGSQSFSDSLSISMNDSSPGASIYYTNDGSMPTPNSTLYTGPITISSTSTLTAIAAGAGYLPSLAASAIFQQNAQPPAPVPSVAEGTYTSSQVFGFGLGFSSSLDGSTQNPQIILNGSSRLDDTRLQLTDGGYLEAGSAYYAVPVDIRSFVTDFSFQISNAGADGFTFVIQANGPNALGGPGSALGYGDDGATSGIPNSVAIKFDVFDNAGEGNDSTGLFLNGSRPLTPSLDLRSAGIDLSSGDTMQVHLSYDGAVLSMTITDGVTYTSYSTTFSVDIPGTVGSSTAYVGFTGATGGETASQKIMNWVFNKLDPSSSVPPVLKSTDF